MRLLAAAVLSTLALAASAERVAKITIPVVDLTLPGAMDALKRSDPARYERVQKELEKNATMPCEYSGPATIQVAPGDARNTLCATPIYTSFPAKRRVSVWVDNTIYEAVVALRDSGGRLHRATSEDMSGRQTLPK